MYLLAAVCSDPHYLSGIIWPVVGSSMMLMVIMISLFWMSAQVFRKPEYEAFVSVELRQLLVSALLFITIFGASCFASQMSDTFAGGDTFAIARNYLNVVSMQVALPALLKLEFLKTWAQYWGSMMFRSGLTVWGAAIAGFPAFPLIERAVEFILMLMTPFVSSLMVQQVGLEIIRGIMMPYVLPAGLVLRIFPPTRDAGAYLIATAIGFEIIFPFTYVMHASIVGQMLNHGSPDLDPAVYAQTFPNLIKDFFSLFNASDMLFAPLKALSFLTLQALFLPALSITLTVSFIKGFTKFIGQKLD